MYSSVIPGDNVERQRADELGLPQRPRGHLHCLRAAGQQVSYIIGGDLLGRDLTAAIRLLESSA